MGYIASNIFRRYDLASVATNATLDLALSNVFTVDASALRTLTFTNLSAASRDATIKVYILGAFAPEITNTVNWVGGEPPDIGENWSILVFSVNDGTLYGNIWGSN